MEQGFPLLWSSMSNFLTLLHEFGNQLTLETVPEPFIA